MRFLAGSPVVLLAACWWLPAQTSTKQAPKPAPVKSAPAKTSPAVVAAKEPPKPPPPEPGTHKLIYGIEWRLIRAGQATVESKGNLAQLRLESAGLFSKL